MNNEVHVALAHAPERSGTEIREQLCAVESQAVHFLSEVNGVAGDALEN